MTPRFVAAFEPLLPHDIVWRWEAGSVELTEQRACTNADAYTPACRFATAAEARLFFLRYDMLWKPT